jgi:hypothetical protein
MAVNLGLARWGGMKILAKKCLTHQSMNDYNELKLLPRRHETKVPKWTLQVAEPLITCYPDWQFRQPGWAFFIYYFQY